MKISPEQLKLYAVTDRSWLKPDETLASVTEELLRAGVSCVQLREKNASDEEILQEAALLKEICERYNVPLIINDARILHRKQMLPVFMSDFLIWASRKHVSFSGLTLSSAEVPIMSKKHLQPECRSRLHRLRCSLRKHH